LHVNRPPSLRHLYLQRYVNIKPGWTGLVHDLEIFERDWSQRQLPFQSNGSSPVCLWLMMFGPSLTNLTSVSLKYLPYLLEAVMLTKMVCPGITSLEVLLHYQDFQEEAFWTTLAGLKKLKVLT